MEKIIFKLCVILIFVSINNESFAKKNVIIQQEQKVHPALLYSIKKYYGKIPIGSCINIKELNKDSLYMKAAELPPEYNKCVFAIIKIFRIKHHTYLSIWQDHGFPLCPNTNEGRIVNNPDNLYYFQLGAINLLVIDDFSNKKGKLNSRNINANQCARAKMNEKDVCPPFFNHREPRIETWQIKKRKMIKKEAMLPPRFENERPFFILEDDDNIKIDFEL